VGSGGLILLDTHVLIWWKAGGGKLSQRAARAVHASDTVLLSAISFWEIAVLERKSRIRLDRDLLRWIGDVLSEDRVREAPVSAQAGAHAGALPDFGGDPADAILYCTARELGAPLVTKDRRLTAYARAHRDVRTVW